MSELGASGSFNSPIESIATDADGNVYTSGYTDTGTNYNYYVAKWNGTAWSELGASGSFNSFIFSIATDAGGNVYAGGNFTDTNNNNYYHPYYVAKWNGTTWSELGCGRWHLTMVPLIALRRTRTEMCMPAATLAMPITIKTM